MSGSSALTGPLARAIVTRPPVTRSLAGAPRQAASGGNDATAGT